MGKTVRFFLCCALLLSGCISGEQKVFVYPRIGIGEKIYLSTVSIDGEYTKKDSCLILESGKMISFNLPEENQLYALTSDFNSYFVVFINDKGDKIIHADYFSRHYSISGSAATKSLIHFQRLQNELEKRRRLAAEKKEDQHAMELAEKKRKYYINYADTVENIKAFLIVNDELNFGQDTRAFEKFMERAKLRFKGNPEFDQIYQRSLVYLQSQKEHPE